MILASKSSAPIIGWVASILGVVMDGIYRVLEAIGIPNLGLCIIIFSIIVYLLMTPLQVKQQKFSKLSAVMQPELQKVQKKYKDKKDQASQQKMQEETMAVYEKYGVSPTGSCLQLIIQMPVLFALWQVIYKIPGYVSSIGAIFNDAVAHIMSVDGYTELIQAFIQDNRLARVQLVMEEGVAKSESIIDFLYALSPAQWTDLASVKEFSGFADVLSKTAGEISRRQTFGVLNIAEQPMTYITAMFKGGAILVGIAAILIPLLSWLTQLLSIKLMPQPENSNNQGGAASTLNTMNTVMPIMSAFFCLSFPVGLGLYWIASAVVRSIQQLVINRQLERIDMDELINENMKKMEKKREKNGYAPRKITNQANQSTKNINAAPKPVKPAKPLATLDENEKKIEQAYQKTSNAKSGSIASKANMVRDYEARTKK